MGRCLFVKMSREGLTEEEALGQMFEDKRSYGEIRFQDLWLENKNRFGFAGTVAQY